MLLEKVQLLMLVLLGNLQCSLGSKVLLIAPLGSKSHWQFFGETAMTLADHGHQVTTLTSKPMLRHKNINEIDFNFDIENFTPNTFENRDMLASFRMASLISEKCAEVISHKHNKDIIVDEYDVIFISIFMNDCFFSLLENTTVPVIMLCPNTIFSYLHDVMGNVDFPSIVPMMGLSMTYPLSFTERLLSTLGNTFSVFYIRWFYLPWMAGACQDAGLCRPNMTPLIDIVLKSSMVFINNVRSLETPARPYVPGVIHAGGLNCRPAQPLPKDLADWIEGSGDAGTIYFSLGSVVKPKDMPEKYRQVLVNTFSRLPQRVIWKWHEDNMEDLPPNVKLGSWLPQQDILGHPNVRLFISHGGLFSTFEATYHAVPILGLPVFADQGSNMHKSTTDGIAETIDWDDLTEDLLLSTIKKMLTNSSYQETVNRRSLVMRDQPLSPQDTVVYWTEYVIRHGGAPHLQSPVRTMPWYVLYNVDVWLSICLILVVLVVVVVKVTKVVVKVTKVVVRKCCYKGAKNNGLQEQLQKKKQYN
ncbi:UDP-glucuronosyl/UDP-glucosyltransferase [Trinorchestia longiramus]|nr:UDP-glucuronosyl/UDP-glucosyltransferase [Trinorchestia longiramus]